MSESSCPSLTQNIVWIGGSRTFSWLWPILGLGAIACGGPELSMDTDAVTARRVLTPQADAWVFEQEPRANHGRDRTLRIKNGTGGSARAAYLRFRGGSDLRNADQVILSLEGRLQSGSDGTVVVSLTSAGWDERRIDWRSSPGATRELGRLRFSRNSSRRTIDLTGALRGQAGSTLALRLEGAKRGNLIALGSRESNIPPRLQLLRASSPPPTSPPPTSPPPTSPPPTSPPPPTGSTASVINDEPWGGRFLGFPVGGGQNRPIKVGGRPATSRNGKWNDARLGLRIVAGRTGRARGIVLRNRATDRNKSGDTCDGGYSGIYCRNGGEYSVGDGGTIIGELFDSGGSDPRNWTPGRSLTQVQPNGGRRDPLVNAILGNAEFIYWAFTTPVNLVAGDVYYLELRQNARPVDAYIGFNMTLINKAPLTDTTRAGPYQGNWEVVASGNRMLRIHDAALPSYQLVMDSSQGRMLVGPSQVYSQRRVSSFLIGRANRARVVSTARSRKPLRRLWVQVDSFPNGTPSRPLQLKLRVDGRDVFTGQIQANRFRDDHTWRSVDLPRGITANRGDEVVIELSSAAEGWGIRTFDVGKWFNKTDARALGSRSVQAAMRDGPEVRLLESRNSGRSWSLNRNSTMPVAVEAR